MNKKRLNYILGFMIALSVAVACEGPTGPQGLQGPEGEQGTQGEPGNANIMYSDWMDIEWNEEGSNDVQKQMPIEELLITEDFLNDGGIVLMFMKVEGGSGIVQFYSLPLITGNGNFHYRFVTFAGQGTGGIVLLLISLDDSTIPDYVWNNFEIRYVLVPGSVNLSIEGVNWDDFYTVSRMFDIEK